MILVVGGQRRKIGKSAVVSALIRALPEAGWTAIKVSPHPHGSPAAAHGFLLTEEAALIDTDSGRFLRAGAIRSFWLRASTAQLPRALPSLEAVIGAAENVIIESTRLPRFLHPDLFLLVADPAVAEWKHSAREQLRLVDAFVVVEHGSRGAVLAAAKPRFPVGEPEYTSPELLSYVRKKLRLSPRCGKRND